MAFIPKSVKALSGCKSRWIALRYAVPWRWGERVHFADTQLQGALVAWRGMADVKERSTADNVWFEQRVSPARQANFEAATIGASDPDRLRKAHADYWSEFVRVDTGDIPHTFDEVLAPADLGAIDETQKIVRIESLDRALNKHDISYDRLRDAVTNDEAPVIDGFFRTWNASNIRDGRPAFAAFKDEVADDLANPEWPSRLRDRLGLAHYDCAAGPIPIALMEYSVAEVKAAAAFAGVSVFTAPTVFDSGPWPYFFPAPPELCCGRTMALYEVADDKELLAEILHFRMAYERSHLVKLDEIRLPPKAFDLRGLRNHHLLALHIAAGRDDFGEEIPA